MTTTSRILQIGITALIAAGLAACTQTTSTVVCWDEPSAQSGHDAIDSPKYGSMQPICAPVFIRLPAPPLVSGGSGTSVGPPPVHGSAPPPVHGSGDTPTASASRSNAQTYRDAQGNSLGTLAVGEFAGSNTPIAGTDRREGAPRTYAGTLDAITTGDAIRNEVAGLGDSIRSGVADSTSGARVE